MQDESRKIVVVCGPTACGKSARAIERAARENGVVINADSQQIYKNLPVLTACPTAEDMAATPHKLYMFADDTEQMDAEKYALLAAREIEQAFADGKTPILTGGTGFYIKALTHGLSPIPEVPTIRNATFEELQTCDLALAKVIKPGDSQRINRAVAVFRATSRPLSYFQSLPLERPIQADFELEIMDMPIEMLETRIALRLDQMIAQGVVEEVEKLACPPDAPIWRVIGATAIREHLDGNLSLEEMKAQIFLETRQYAKRQRTFFRTQLKG
ncbi:MAG: tRNA (adenosine(37)-N6)-dimethylallyltransferase MiaA [Rickettsiales bacterium]|jgi:tRNA dimethylallyltransferase|nr:tRNA (adenosine(37)-N6)-dimethylallyltransferase MiaA [Rickettsiales bacterium]